MGLSRFVRQACVVVSVVPLVWACDGAPVAPEKVPPLVSPEVVLLPLGAEQRLSVVGAPTGAAPASWSVSDSSIASVSAEGLVRGMGVGTAVVRADVGETGATAQVSVVASFAAATAGERFTCAVTDAGTGACWGWDWYGQLGTGETPRSEKHSPRARALLEAPRLSAIDAGSSHTCGLDRAGKAYCWGSSYSGQLGTGSSGDFHALSKPTPVSTSLAFTEITAGGQHSCALTADGTAYCWGAAGRGQVGGAVQTVCKDHYGMARGSCALVPAPVSGGLTFRAISAGDLHTCALTDTGAAYCWGANERGSAGGTVTPIRVPEPVPGGLSFGSVSAGSAHTCALDAQGRAWCWGTNTAGQLGTGTADTLAHNEPTAVSGDLRFRSISAGGSHTCGAAVGGAVYCWGDNRSGQLGDGGGLSGASPRRVVSLAASRVTVGAAHSCALGNDRLLYCWGSGSKGELGTGVSVGSTVPVRVFGQ